MRAVQARCRASRSRRGLAAADGGYCGRVRL
jgi:hypothetical protein